MGQSRSDGAANGRIVEDLPSPADLRGSYATKIDGPKLVDEHDGIERLTGDARGDGDLAWVAGRPRRDRTDRGHAGPMERPVRHDERPSGPLLLVTDRWIEVEDDDRPAVDGFGHRGAQAGQLSRSS